MMYRARDVLCLTALTLPTAGCGSLEVAAASLGIVGGGLAIGVAGAEKANLETEKTLQAQQGQLQKLEQQNLEQSARIAETELAVASKELELLNRGAGHRLTISGDIGVTVRAVKPDGSFLPATIKDVSVTTTTQSNGMAMGVVTPEGSRDLAKYLRRDRRKDAENPAQALNPLTTISVGREVLIDVEIDEGQKNNSRECPIGSPLPNIDGGAPESASPLVLPSSDSGGLRVAEASPSIRWGTLTLILGAATFLVWYSRRSGGR